MKFSDDEYTEGSSNGIFFRNFSVTFIFFSIALVWQFGCSLIATRPVQDMSDTLAAIRSAKEVQADILSPELYRQSTEYFIKAKQEYRYKNFKLAKENALKARHLAELAELESLRNGGNRVELAAPPDPLAMSDESVRPNTKPKAASSYDYPVPAGTPAETFEQQKAAEEAAANKAAAGASPPDVTPAPEGNANPIPGPN